MSRIKVAAVGATATAGSLLLSLALVAAVVSRLPLDQASFTASVRTGRVLLGLAAVVSGALGGAVTAGRARRTLGVDGRKALVWGASVPAAVALLIAALQRPSNLLVALFVLAFFVATALAGAALVLRATARR